MTRADEATPGIGAAAPIYFGQRITEQFELILESISCCWLVSVSIGRQAVLTLRDILTAFLILSLYQSVFITAEISIQDRVGVQRDQNVDNPRVDLDRQT